jgi:hypothetical protein
VIGRKKSRPKVTVEENEDGIFRLVVRDAKGRVVTGPEAQRAVKDARDRLRARS